MIRLKGSALPTVLVVCILICLLVLFAFMLFDMNSLLYSVYRSDRQRKEFLNSAFLLYCRDSTLFASPSESVDYRLYADKEASAVRIRTALWGLYETVCISSADDKYQSVRLLGKQQDCVQQAALWMCNLDGSLSLAGNTRITGPVFAPNGEVSYTQPDDEPFTGNTVSEYDMYPSERELPPVDSVYLERINAFYEKMKLAAQVFPADQESVYNSFTGETVCFHCPPQTGSVFLRGNVILYGDEVTVSKETAMADVILVARKVYVEDGFSGSMQIMASDTVILGQGVRLHYPSGVCVNGNQGKTYLEIGTGSVLDGYAVVEGNTEKEDILRIFPSYCQRENASLGGLLYVDGIASISGTVFGAAYIKECYYLPPNGSYAGTLYDVEIVRNEQAAYPFFFESSAFQRREMKSVD